MLSSGTYVGVDIIRDSIEWCSSNISARYPAVQFEHLNIRDQIHNPSGISPAEAIQLPVEAGSRDLVFAFSVFTHLFESDISYYLSEFERIMRPGGLAYLTCFIYSDEALLAARKTNLTPWDLKSDYRIYPGCRINDPAHPLGAIAYTEEKLCSLVKEKGLRLVEPPLKGAWSGLHVDAVDGQDVLLLTK